MITFKDSWILVLVAMAACGRSPLQQDHPLVVTDSGLPPCERGLTQCGRRDVSLCYDLRVSQDHCGACGHTCPLGIACQEGICQQTRCKGPLSFKAIDHSEPNPADMDRPYRPVLGDFDGDGKLDLAGVPVATDPDGILKGAHVLIGTNLLYGMGDGTFSDARRIENSRILNWQLYSIDVDGDGILDLVSINERDSAVSVRRGSGKRDAPLGEATIYPTSQPPFNLLVTDLDFDGHPDMVASVASNLEIWQGQGTGRFEHQATLPSRGVSTLMTADWNNDGALDLVYGSSNLQLRYGRGDGTFDPEVVCALALAGSPRWLYNPPLAPLNIAADLDHDNVIDLVGQTSVFLGLDGCTPSRMVPLVRPGVPVESPVDTTTLADLDGDGNLDILARSEVLLGDGKGGFSQPLSLSGPAGVFLVGDLNRDGKLDLVAVGVPGWQVLLNTCQ